MSDSTAKVAAIINDRIIAALDKGTVPWRKPWVGAHMAPRNIKGRRYSGINAFLLAALGYSDPRFLTFKQAQALGGKVRPGSKGFPVVFWKRIQIEDENKDGEKVKKTIPLLRYFTVFNVEQVVGLDIEPIDNNLPCGGNPDENAEAIVDGYLTRDDAPTMSHDGGDRAFYRPDSDTIHLPNRDAFYTTTGYYETTFHELGHSTGHKSRLDRDHTGHFGSEMYSREELVAEFCAAYLMGEAGLDGESEVANMAAYIASWKKAIEDDPRLIVVAAGRGEKAARYILGNLNDDEPKED